MSGTLKFQLGANAVRLKGDHPDLWRACVMIQYEGRAPELWWAGDFCHAGLKAAAREAQEWIDEFESSWEAAGQQVFRPVAQVLGDMA